MAAKSAGLTAKQSAEEALAWAAPRVKDARAWAAPHVEQAGLAVRDKIAPAISEKIAPTISSALVEAAHRLDDSAPRRRDAHVIVGPDREQPGRGRRGGKGQRAGAHVPTRYVLTPRAGPDRGRPVTSVMP
jgi:hypothetical protein